MKKSVQKYLLMIKLSPNMAAKLYEPLMEFDEKPMEGVKLEEAYQVFGQWDFAVLFQADTNENALHFVGDKIRLIEGVTRNFHHTTGADKGLPQIIDVNFRFSYFSLLQLLHHRTANPNQRLNRILRGQACRWNIAI